MTAIHTIRWHFIYRYKNSPGDKFIGADEFIFTYSSTEALRLLYEKHHGCAFLEILDIKTEKAIIRKSKFNF